MLWVECRGTFQMVFYIANIAYCPNSANGQCLETQRAAVFKMVIGVTFLLVYQTFIIVNRRVPILLVARNISQIFPGFFIAGMLLQILFKNRFCLAEIFLFEVFLCLLVVGLGVSTERKQ